MCPFLFGQTGIGKLKVTLERNKVVGAYIGSDTLKREEMR